MQKRTYLICLVLLTLLAPRFAVHASSLGIEKNVVEYKLPNGMQWLLMRRAGAPVFAGVVQIRVGSIEEEAGRTGLAHMFEHMAFKGTDNIKPEEIWDAFVTNGASNLNAYTSKDTTAYHAKMPASKLPLWIYLNSEMIKHPTMMDFEKERDVVLEELVGKIENNPIRKMDADLLRTAFKESPYKWPTIGMKLDVANLKAKDLETFRKKYYVPERMTGAIVGDIDIERTKGLIFEYFGDMPRGKNPPEKFSAEPVQTEERKVRVHFDASPRLMLAFHKPTLPSPDDDVFDVISYILCYGENSRLNKELVYEKKMVQGVACDSSYPGARLDDLFVITTEPAKGFSYDEVTNVIVAELERLKTEPVTESELSKARNNAARDFVFQMKGNEGIAQTLAFFQMVAGDWRYVTRHLDVINKVTAEDIIKTAKKYLNKENMTIAELVK